MYMAVGELGIFWENPVTYLIYYENEGMEKNQFFCYGVLSLITREKAVICINLTSRV
jgi:hypothetical protein